MIANVAVLAAFAYFFSLVSARISSTAITGPMIFVLFGLVAGPWGLALLDLDMDAYGVRVFADWTLALILFTDAAEANRSSLMRKIDIPERMLLIGLPIVMLLGFAVGWLLFGALGIWQVAIIAVCLSATDAALGKETLHDKDVPDYLRTGLNVESGLNDGLTVPVLLVLISFAVAESDVPLSVLDVATIVVREIGVGVLVGVVSVALGVWLMQQARKWEWVDPVWSQIPVVALALCAFAVAQQLEGSGYIAAYCGGLTFRLLEKQSARKMIFSATEMGATLSLLVWTFFGTVMLEWIVPVFEWQMLLYGLLSLTVIRTLPILLSLMGTGETLAAKIYLGWFGPRGLASLVFVVIVKDSGVPNADYIVGCVFCTVIMSVFIHGLSTHIFSHLLVRNDKMVRKR